MDKKTLGEQLRLTPEEKREINSLYGMGPESLIERLIDKTENSILNKVLSHPDIVMMAWGRPYPDCIIPLSEMLEVEK